MKLSKAQVKALEAVEDGMFLTVDDDGKRTFYSGNHIPRLSTMLSANIGCCIISKYKWRNAQGHAVYDVVLTAEGRKALEEARNGK